jgi:N12 class adenine-specific DNA methylase
MIDRKLIVAEMRAGDLLSALQAAVNGDHHWRHHAHTLLDDIDNLRLPDLATARLREIDATKRAIEIADDLLECDAP